MRILRIELGGRKFDFNYDKLSYYHYEEQKDGRIAFVVKEIDEKERHIFNNHKSLKIQLVEE